MKDLVIIGAGDRGREVVGLIELINVIYGKWTIDGFVDDNSVLKDRKVWFGTEFFSNRRNLEGAA